MIMDQEQISVVPYASYNEAYGQTQTYTCPANRLCGMRAWWKGQQAGGRLYYDMYQYGDYVYSSYDTVNYAGTKIHYDSMAIAWEPYTNISPVSNAYLAEEFRSLPRPNVFDVVYGVDGALVGIKGLRLGNDSEGLSELAKEFGTFYVEFDRFMASSLPK
jgi:hypothetical protein